MSIRNTFAIAAVAFILAPACKKKDDGGGGDAPEPPADTATADTPDAPADGGEKKEPEAPADTEKKPVDAAPTMANKMMHCPSAVKGAKTKVEKGGGMVTVTVTGADEAGTAEIRKRAGHLVKVAGADASKVTHSGEGTGSAVLGKCPVVIADVNAKMEEVEGGVKVSLEPKDATKIEALYTMANQRAMALGHGGRPGGTGGHGSGTGGGRHGGGGSGGHGSGTGGGSAEAPAKAEPAKAEPAKAAPPKKEEGAGW